MNTIKQLNGVMKHLSDYNSQKCGVVLNCGDIQCSECPVSEYKSKYSHYDACELVINTEDFADFISTKYETLKVVDWTKVKKDTIIIARGKRRHFYYYNKMSDTVYFYRDGLSSYTAEEGDWFCLPASEVKLYEEMS